MYTFTLPIPDTYSTIMRPAIYSIIAELKTMRVLPNIEKIVYTEINKEVDNKGNKINAANRLDKLDAEACIYVNVIKKIKPTSGLGLHVGFNHIKPIFHDKDLNIKLTPLYNTIDIELEIRCVSTSRNFIKEWMSEYTALLQLGALTRLHKLEYRYRLPKGTYALLDVLHGLREKVAPYDEDFATWLKKHSAKELSKDHSITGTYEQYAYTEYQTNVQGLFEELEPSYETDGDTKFSGTFTYKVSMDKPTNLLHTYPIMIHNQLIPIDYTVPVDYGDDTFEYSNDALTRQLGVVFNAKDILSVNAYPIRTPDVDHFNILHNIVGYFKTAVTLTSVDEDKKGVVNLESLGRAVIDPEIIAWLKAGEYEHVIKPYHSMFNISVYRIEEPMDHTLLALTPLLELSSIKELNLRQTHRVVVNICSDLSYLTEDALVRVVNNKKVLNILIESLYRAGQIDITVRAFIINSVGEGNITLLRAFINRLQYQNMRLTDVSKSAAGSLSKAVAFTDKHMALSSMMTIQQSYVQTKIQN